MILHTVAFSLKHSPESIEEKAFLAAAQTLESIVGVHDFKCYRQVGKKSSFRFALSMTFVDQAAYDAYNEHPKHKEFVEQRWLPEVSDFQELDYEEYIAH